MNAIYKRIGKNIRSMRLTRSMSQQTMATALNLNQSAVSRIESGNQKLSIEEALILAKLFDCTLDELLNHNGKRGSNG